MKKYGFFIRYWDYTGQRLYQKTGEMRLQGFSGPAMGHISELEYGGITERMENLEERFVIRNGKTQREGEANAS